MSIAEDKPKQIILAIFENSYFKKIILRSAALCYEEQ